MANSCPPYVPDCLDPNTILTSQPMGIGKLGDPDIIMKRKFRWLFSISVCNGACVPPHYVKVASRPNVTIEETELNFLNQKTWVPGKAAWDTIDVTYLDVAVTGGNADNIGLWDWLASVYDYTSGCYWMNSRRSDYAGTGMLSLLDGCGNELEFWTMGDMWPTSIKFGELDYSSSEFVEINLTLRYSAVTYENLCGRDPQGCPCTGCGDSGITGGAGAVSSLTGAGGAAGFNVGPFDANLGGGGLS